MVPVRRIAVVGGGPAGCRAGEILARNGHEVTLFDARGAWEKPCGGGVTPKAMALLPAEASAEVRYCRTDRLALYFGTRGVEFSLDDAPRIFSRKELGAYLLHSASTAGVRLVRERVARLERIGNEWRIQFGKHRQPDVRADFLVGADGATSFVRRSVGVPLGSGDFSATAGYFIPHPGSSRMTIHFRPDLEGYIWSFPRPDHVSFGMIMRPEPGWATRSRTILEAVITEAMGTNALESGTFYSAPVPCLSPRAWETNGIAGDGWALVGDAAGLVDPITGEGIYYALRSGELLGKSGPDATTYLSAVQAEIVPELVRAARMYERFYRGRFFGADFRQRMVQFAAVSPAIQKILGDLASGARGYSGLKRHLAAAIPRVGRDLLWHALSR